MRAWWLVGLLFTLLGCSGGDWGPGVAVEGEPRQWEVDRTQWQQGDFSLEALAGFEVTARVLSVKEYGGKEGALSPVDLALGWGRMSEDEVLDALTIRQSGRWYTYRWSDAPPIPPGEIIQSSANMHMIPATPEVAEALGEVVKGDLVTLKGTLVSIQGPSGFRWRSSLSRKDTGGGACEIVWVKSVERTPAP